MSKNPTKITVQAFWHEIRQARFKQRRSRAKVRRAGVVRFTRQANPRVPSEIQAHRAAIEHDCFCGDPRRKRLVRAAARVYDKWLAATWGSRFKQRKHRAAGERSGGHHVAGRRAAA